MSKSKILLQVTGSIAAYKVCELLSTLVKADYEVKVVASENALRFVGAATWEGLSGSPVYSDLWQQGRMMDHIELNRWADLILVVPATASYINRAASGTGGDLLTTLFLAHDFKKPFLLAPAMNQAMYQHPVTHKSLSLLREMGVEILDPENGNLACGEIGPGRLMEPENIFARIQARLQPRHSRVLITSGGTVEPIDDVRGITNISTGVTGATIADQLIRDGFDVTYLGAKTAAKPTGPCRLLNFSSFKDLQMLLQNELQEKYSAVIHAAAVSDYSPTPLNGKIPSQSEHLNIELQKNPKLVNQLRGWSINKDLRLIAFKLTSSDSAQHRLAAVDTLGKNSTADLVIQNDFSDFKNGGPEHPFAAYRNSQSVFAAKNKADLAQKISHYLVKESPL